MAWDVLASAFFGAFLAFAFARYAEWLQGRLTKGRNHRTALVRVVRQTHDHLNQIITNQRLALDARDATAQPRHYWKFPHPFAVDGAQLSDLIDRDLILRVLEVNTHLLRYNHDVEDLREAHHDLQQSHLRNTLPDEVWVRAMREMAPQWQIMAEIFTDLDNIIRDIHVRAGLLLRQYDHPRIRWLRLAGVVKTWPLDPLRVAEERMRFDAEWQSTLRTLSERWGEGRQAA